MEAAPSTILVADDNPAIRRVTREILEDCGYHVLEASDGKQASQMLRQEKVDLLVTDLIMPGQEGLETIMDARRHFPALRILVMSGSSGAYLDGAARLGADGTLRKPFTVEALREKVKELLVRPGGSSVAQ